MFYVYSQVSYAGIKDEFVDEYEFAHRVNQDAKNALHNQNEENRYARATAPQMVDRRIYSAETNEPIGRCEPNRNLSPAAGYFGSVACKMYQGTYENWECYFDVGMNAIAGKEVGVDVTAVELRCKNSFVDYQQKLIDNMPGIEEGFRQSVTDEANRVRADFKNEKQSQTFADRIRNIGGNVVGDVYTIKVSECIKQAGNAKIDDVFAELKRIVNPDQKYSEELWQRIRYAGWRIGMPFDDARYNGTTLDDEIHAIVYQCKINNQ